jgi:hypothetical protein
MSLSPLPVNSRINPAHRDAAAIARLLRVLASPNAAPDQHLATVICAGFKSINRRERSSTKNRLAGGTLNARRAADGAKSP